MEEESGRLSGRPGHHPVRVIPGADGDHLACHTDDVVGGVGDGADAEFAGPTNPDLFLCGVWADRYDRKKLIITADAAIAVATLALALFLMVEKTGQYELWAILAVSFIRSVGSGIQSPAVSAVVPDLVAEDQLSRFNGINASIQSLVQFTTPAAAGAIMAAGPISTLLMIDVLTAVVGIGILLFIQIPKRHPTGEAKQNPFFADMKAGIAYAFGHKLIGGLFLIFGVFIFLSVPSGFLTTLMVQRTFGDNYLYLSINETLGFAGMVVGGLLLGAWGGFRNRIKTLVAGCCCMALHPLPWGSRTCSGCLQASSS